MKNNFTFISGGGVAARDRTQCYTYGRQVHYNWATAQGIKITNNTGKSQADNCIKIPINICNSGFSKHNSVVLSELTVLYSLQQDSDLIPKHAYSCYRKLDIQETVTFVLPSF